VFKRKLRERRMCQMHSSACLIAVACLVLAAMPASAQTDRGIITRTVSDPAGGVISSASIEARNTSTEAVCLRLQAHQPGTIRLRNFRQVHTSYQLRYQDSDNTIPRVEKTTRALFAQDSWKKSLKLTLDYRLRRDCQDYLNKCIIGG
jgi:hypothetical protein